MDFTYFLANPSKLKGGSSIIPQKNETSTKTITTVSSPDISHEHSATITKCDISGVPNPNENPKPKQAMKKSMMMWTDLIVNQKKKMN